MDIEPSKQFPLWYQRGFSQYLSSYTEPKDQIMLGGLESMGQRLNSLFLGNERLRKLNIRALMTRQSFDAVAGASAMNIDQRVRFSAAAFVSVHYFFADTERR